MASRFARLRRGRSGTLDAVVPRLDPQRVSGERPVAETREAVEVGVYGDVGERGSRPEHKKAAALLSNLKARRKLETPVLCYEESVLVRIRNSEHLQRRDLAFLVTHFFRTNPLEKKYQIQRQKYNGFGHRIRNRSALARSRKMGERRRQGF